MEEKLGSELKTNSITWGNYKDATFNITRGKYLSNNTWKTVTNYTKTASSIVLTTGATNRNSTLNIYDLAGNVWEWTLEYTSDPNSACTPRGGCYNDSQSNYPACYRSRNGVSYNDIYVGIRTALW